MPPLLHLIENDLLKESDSDSTLTSDIKQRIKLDVSNCYTVAQLGEQSPMVLKLASFLDPRFKTKYISSEEIANAET